MSNEKQEREYVYIGEGKLKTFDNGGTHVSGSIKMEKINEGYLFKSENTGAKFMNVTVGERKEADQYGNTHWIKQMNANQKFSKKESHPAHTNEVTSNPFPDLPTKGMTSLEALSANDSSEIPF